MIIALFPNINKKSAGNLARGICEFLVQRDIDVVVDDAEAAAIEAPPLSSVDAKAVDFSISMGGDGTILRLIHQHPELEAPIFGINLGGLGFMADIPISEVYPSLQSLIDGNYRVQQRLMMEGCSVHNGRCFAVNEMAVHRAQNPSLIELAVHVDGLYLNTFGADGIIIATPSGSTAYSLAAGGPILMPELQAFVITPISPHTISNRPVVLMPEKDIQIQYLSEHDPVEIAFDGISRCTMNTGEVFHITVSKRVFSLVSLPHHDYFATLRTKLGWSGKLKA